MSEKLSEYLTGVYIRGGATETEATDLAHAAEHGLVDALFIPLAAALEAARDAT